jgi:hypothetical protein
MFSFHHKQFDVLCRLPGVYRGFGLPVNGLVAEGKDTELNGSLSL